MDKSIEIIRDFSDYYSNKASLMKDFFTMLMNQSIGSLIEFFPELMVKILETPSGNLKFNEIMGCIHQSLIMNMSKLKVEDEISKWNQYINAIMALVHRKETAKVFIDLELFILNNVFTNFIEYNTILGNLLRYSCIPETSMYGVNYFSNNSSTSHGRWHNLKRNREILGDSIDSMQNKIENIIMKLYQEHKLNEVIQWFKKVANKNIDLLKMMHGQNVSSLGFILNSFVVLLGICNSYTKDCEEYIKFCKMIDSKYCKMSELDYRNIEFINKSGIKETKEDEKIQFNEITETFFLAHYYMNLSFRQISEVVKRLWMKYNRNKDETVLTMIYAYYIHTFSQKFMNLLADFLSFSSCVLLFKVKPADCPFNEYFKSIVDLNLPKEVPEDLASLPEHILLNINDSFEFYFQNFDDDIFRLNKMMLPLFNKIYVIFIAIPYCTNLHLRGKMTEFHGSIIRERDSKRPRELILYFHNDKLFKNYVMEALMKAFVYVEKTGTSSQFYDKFQYRSSILETIKYVWTNEGAKERWKSIWENDKTNGIMFSNYLLNDFTHIHDELFIKLQEIKELEEALAEDEMSHSMPAEERKEKERHLKQNESTVKIYVGLVNLMMKTISDMTEVTPEMYTSEDLIDHFTTSLNFYLKQLTVNESTIHV